MEGRKTFGGGGGKGDPRGPPEVVHEKRKNGGLKTGQGEDFGGDTKEALASRSCVEASFIGTL